MIVTEYNITRGDGVKLYRTYSDADLMIQKDGTEEIYAEAIDVENSSYTYTETDIPVRKDADKLTLEDTLGMLSELGVSVNDN